MIKQAKFIWDYKNTTKNESTHTSLAQGKFIVKLSDYSVFLQKYVNAFKHNEDVYLTERILKNSHFRFFMDLDFELNDTVKKNSSEYKLHYKTVYSAVQDTLDTPVFLSVRLSKIHVHCPDLIVTSEQARIHCNDVKKVLMEKIEQRWVEIADTAKKDVYFYVGNLKRFRQTFMVLGVFYPPSNGQ